MNTVQNPQDDPDIIAGLKAEKRTDLQFDFDLEDIIAGNTPEGEIGRQLEVLVEDTQGTSTQGKVETALLPLYETMLADVFRKEGGIGQPPAANRHNVRQHAIKVMQARKVKRTALMRASRHALQPLKTAPQSSVPLLAIIFGLVIVIAAVIYSKS